MTTSEREELIELIDWQDASVVIDAIEAAGFVIAKPASDAERLAASPDMVAVCLTREQWGVVGLWESEFRHADGDYGEDEKEMRSVRSAIQKQIGGNDADAG